jgi:hypothetical protein
MRAVPIPDAVGFEARMRDLLLQREAENHLMLGIAGSLISNAPSPQERRFFWAVVEGARLLGGALWTPPFKPVLTGMDDAALGVLLERMLEAEVPLNGISGPVPAVAHFAGLWSARTGGAARRVMGMRIRELTQVSGLVLPPGRFRGAVREEIGILTGHARSFHDEIGIDEPVDVAKEVGDYLRDGRLFVWEDGGRIVSMAGCVGPTPNGARLNLVYTPPEGRGRGYSRACVSGLCRWLLAQGRKSCYLFADAANPVSNRVYDRVGFTDVCDWEMYGFAASTPRMG